MRKLSSNHHLTALFAIASLAAVSSVGCRQILGIEDPVACSTDDACTEEDLPCVTGECVDGACVYGVREQGFVVGEGELGDCSRSVCDGQGTVVLAVATDDAPEDTTPGDCKTPSCDADGNLVDAPLDDPPADDTSGDCKQPACDNGAIVDGPSVQDIPTDTTLGDCQRPSCSDAGEIVSVEDATDTPDMDIPGDCHKPTCTAGGLTVDDADVPAIDCAGCVDGAITPWAEVNTACYTGDAGTLNVGNCVGGTWLCDANNAKVCDGQVVPGTEQCGPGFSGFDEDCNGQTDESGVGCACVIGQMTTCYDGTNGTAGMGLCHTGTATCAATPQGNAYGACMGQVTNLPLDSCVVTGDEDCNGTTEACTGNYVWAKNFGNANSESPSSVVEASDGSVFVMTNLVGSLTVNNTVTDDGFGDVAVIKLDSSGNGLGIRAYGGIGADLGGAITKLDDGIVLTMTLGQASAETFGGPAAFTGVSGDGMVVKLDNDFNYQWAKLIGGPSSESTLNVARMPDNGVVVAGVFSSATINLGGQPLSNVGNQDIFVVRYDANGNHIWSKAFGTTAFDEIGVLAVTPAGDVVFGADSQGSMNFGGGALTNAGGYDGYVVKLSGATGATLWAHAVKSSLDEYAPSLAVQSDGSIWAAGGVTGALNVNDVAGNEISPVGAGTDLYLLKYDTNGAYQSSAVYNGTTTVWPKLSIAPDDSLVVGGFYQGSLSLGAILISAGSNDGFLAKFNPAGTLQWRRGFGGTGNDSVAKPYVAANLELLLTGSYSTNMVNFGGGNLPNAGMSDVVVARYRQ